MLFVSDILTTMNVACYIGRREAGGNSNKTCLQLTSVSGQLPMHQDNSHHVHVGMGYDEWLYWLLVVLVGSCPIGKLS